MRIWVQTAEMFQLGLLFVLIHLLDNSGNLMLIHVVHPENKVFKWLVYAVGTGWEACRIALGNAL